MDEECGGIYLINGKGQDEVLEYMSPLLDLPISTPFIINQLNCLEQFFKVKESGGFFGSWATDRPIMMPFPETTKTRQDVLKIIIFEWDGIIPNEVEPFRNACYLL